MFAAEFADLLFAQVALGHQHLVERLMDSATRRASVAILDLRLGHHLQANGELAQKEVFL
jgi:hypothetical protein